MLRGFVRLNNSENIEEDSLGEVRIVSNYVDDELILTGFLDPSYNGISSVWNSFRISGLIGAAPVIAYTQLDIPIASFAFFLIIPPRIGTLANFILLPSFATRLL